LRRFRGGSIPISDVERHIAGCRVRSIGLTSPLGRECAAALRKENGATVPAGDPYIVGSPGRMLA
jgi:hypothetical protein